MANSKNSTSKNQQENPTLKDVAAAKQSVAEIAEAMLKITGLTPIEENVVRKLNELADKMCVPTWMGRGKGNESKDMSDSKKYLDFLICKCDAAIKDVNPQDQPFFNLSNLADEYLLALDNLYKAVEYEKGKQRREANANNISNGTFRDLKDYDYDGVICHSHPTRTLKKFKVPVGFNNDDVKIDIGSRQENGLYTIILDNEEYKDVSFEDLLASPFINRLFQQFVTAPNMYLFDPVDLLFSLLQGAALGYRDDRPLAIKIVTDYCLGDSSARNLRDWLTKDHFTKFYRVFASVVTQVIYSENKHNAQHNSNDALTRDYYKLAEKIGVDDFVCHDGITTVVNNSVGLTHECKGNGSYQKNNKSEGNRKYNSKGRNSHTKIHCAFSLLAMLAICCTITEGCAGEAMNVDSKALTNVGKICLIMDRGYRSILHLMLADYYGHYFLAREHTNCAYVIVKVYDHKGKEIPHLTNLLNDKSVTSPAAKKAIAEYGVLDFSVVAYRYVGVNTIPEEVDHMVDKATRKDQNQRRAIMGLKRLVAVSKSWKHRNDHELIRECLSHPDFDVYEEDEEIDVAPYLKHRKQSKNNTENDQVPIDEGSLASDEIMYLITNLPRDKANALDIRKLYLLRWTIELFAKIEKQNYSLQRNNSRNANSTINLQTSSLILGAINSYLAIKAGCFINKSDSVYDITHFLNHLVAANLGVTRQFTELFSLFGVFKKLRNDESPKKAYNPCAFMPKSKLRQALEESDGQVDRAFFRAEDYRALQKSNHEGLCILDFSHKAIRELLFNAVEGNEACIDLLDKFDKAMNQLGYPSVNTKGVIEEVRSLCEAHNIPIAMALIKPKTPAQISFLSAASSPYMGQLLQDLRKQNSTYSKETNAKIGNLFENAAKRITKTSIATHISLRAFENMKDMRLILMSILGMPINMPNKGPDPDITTESPDLAA